MRSVLPVYAMLVIGTMFLGCKSDDSESVTKAVSHPLQHRAYPQKDNSKYYTLQDTVVIDSEIGEVLKYSKEEFKNIIDNHPEFFKDIPPEPTAAYYCNPVPFGSEQGNDAYCQLYAYFLKQRNGAAQNAVQREHLIKLYSNINDLFGRLAYGGTYFGHQSIRLLATAEYDIYQYSVAKEEGIAKGYDIKRQKLLYLQTLRQLIDDEVANDPETRGKQKHQRQNELNEIVDEIDSLIMNMYYLRKVQQFHYSNYSMVVR